MKSSDYSRDTSESCLTNPVRARVFSFPSIFLCHDTAIKSVVILEEWFTLYSLEKPKHALEGLSPTPCRELGTQEHMCFPQSAKPPRSPSLVGPARCPAALCSSTFPTFLQGLPRRWSCVLLWGSDMRASSSCCPVWPRLGPSGLTPRLLSSPSPPPFSLLFRCRGTLRYQGQRSCPCPAPLQHRGGGQLRPGSGAGVGAGTGGRDGDQARGEGGELERCWAQRPLPAPGRSGGPAVAGAVVLNGRSGGERRAGDGRPAPARGAHITPPPERGVPRQLAGCGTWRC